MSLIKTINELKNVFPSIVTNEFINTMPRRELTDYEKSLPYSKYYFKDMAKIPQEDLDIVNKGPVNSKSVIDMHNISKLFDKGYLEIENGYCYMNDGTGFAASKVFMKDVELEMLDWWFNWHPLEDLRYAIWCPVAHNGTSVKTPNEHLDSSGVDLKVRNYNKTHYPDEGFNLNGHEVLTINFKDPSQLGFDIKDNHVYLASVTRRVLFFNLPVATFVHCARKVEGGTEFRSRYYQSVYINKKGKFKKSIIKFPKSVVESLARNNCLHSLTEYNNLASILPSLYKEERGEIK
ncbi:MAG: hypothetical protein R3Y13_04570 [bacterium]